MPHHHRDRPLRILFIADAADLTALAREALAATAWDVVAAAGAGAAMFLAHRGRFDVIVCGTASSAAAVCELVADGTVVLLFGDAVRSTSNVDVRCFPRPSSAVELRARVEELEHERLPSRSIVKATARAEDAADDEIKKRARG